MVNNLSQKESDYLEGTLPLNTNFLVDTTDKDKAVSEVPFVSKNAAIQHIASQEKLKSLDATVEERERGYVIVIDKNKLTKQVSEIAEIIKPIIKPPKQEMTDEERIEYLSQGSKNPIKGWTIEGDKYVSRPYQTSTDAYMAIYEHGIRGHLSELFCEVVEKNGSFYIRVNKDNIDRKLNDPKHRKITEIDIKSNPQQREITETDRLDFLKKSPIGCEWTARAAVGGKMVYSSNKAYNTIEEAEKELEKHGKFFEGINTGVQESKTSPGSFKIIVDQDTLNTKLKTQK